jgi:hypothetical protein
MSGETKLNLARDAVDKSTRGREERLKSPRMAAHESLLLVFSVDITEPYFICAEWVSDC